MKTKLPSAPVLLLLGGAAFGSGCGRIEIGADAAGGTATSAGANSGEAGGSSAIVGRGGVAGRFASGGVAGTIASGGAAGRTASGGVAGTVASGGVAGIGASGGVAGIGASGGVAGMGASGGVAGIGASGGVGGMVDSGGASGAAGASCAPPDRQTWYGCHLGQPCLLCADAIADYPFYPWRHPQCKRSGNCNFENQGSCSSDCPPPSNADRCDGTDGVWDGCRGTGCYVCTELVADYPHYFVNHPYCTSNPTCAGEHYTCNAACPAPGAADK